MKKYTDCQTEFKWGNGWKHVSWESIFILWKIID